MSKPERKAQRVHKKLSVSAGKQLYHEALKKGEEVYGGIVRAMNLQPFHRRLWSAMRLAVGRLK